jgi:hypothetical protein
MLINIVHLEMVPQHKVYFFVRIMFCGNCLATGRGRWARLSKERFMTPLLR